MKPITYSLFLIIAMSVSLLSSCDDDDSDNCTDARQEYTWTPNKSILFNPRVDSVIVNDSVIYLSEFSIIDGQGNLFEFTRLSQACPDVLDSGGGAVLSFVVSHDSTENFNYNDIEILETSAHQRGIGNVGICGMTIEQGTINGTRIDENTWQIAVDIIPNDDGDCPPQRITFDQIFSLEYSILKFEF